MRIVNCVSEQNGMVDTSPFHIQTDPPGPDAQIIAEKQLRETAERVKESTEELRRLLREDDTIYFRDDDDILLIFLRPTKFNPQYALQMMKRVADFKEENALVLDGLNPASEKAALLDNRVVNVLVDRDQHGRRILVANVGGAWDTNKISTDKLFRLFYMIHLAAIMEPETQIRGVVVILDFHKLGFAQVKEMTMSPLFSKRLLTFIQDAMPLRLKEVHVVKQPIMFNVVWTIFNNFVKPKLRKRLFFHGTDMTKLHKYLHPDYLPKNYGGNKPEINYSSADWYPVLSSLEDHIIEWQTFGKVKKGAV